MNIRLTSLGSALILGTTLSLSGCASLSLYESFDPTDQRTVEKTLGHDEMLAIGQSVKSESEHLNDGVVFVGKKYTYLVTDGAEPFLALVKEFPANKLVLESNIPIKFDFSDSTNFNNTIIFSYADPVEKIPAAQLQRLKQLGFTPWRKVPNAAGQHDTYLRNVFQYRGQLYKPVDATQIAHRFSKAYPIILIQEQEKNNVNVVNIGKTIILAPLAVSFDIITSPIWGSFLFACRNTNCFQ